MPREPMERRSIPLEQPAEPRLSAREWGFERATDWDTRPDPDFRPPTVRPRRPSKTHCKLTLALGNCISFRNPSSDSYTPVANRLGLLSDRADSGLGSH